MTPCAGALNNLRHPARIYLCALDGIQNGCLVIENLHRRARNNSLDFRRLSLPKTPSGLIPLNLRVLQCNLPKQ